MGLGLWPMGQLVKPMKFNLKPNCLLTRRPLKLVTGPRSLFFYKNPWDLLPEVLYEHGYQVELFHLPFRGPEQRKFIFEKNKHHLENSHIIIDEQTYHEFEHALKNIENTTLTVIGSPNAIPTSPTTFVFTPNYKPLSLSYVFHRKWLQFLGQITPDPQYLFIKADEKTWFPFIDHCVKLAELDFMIES